MKRIAWTFPALLVFFEIALYLSNDMYLPGLTSLIETFNINQDQGQYTLMVWFIGSSVTQLFVGPISDALGRKPLIIASALVFAFTSFICATTASIEIMYLARFFQGVCVGVVGVAGYAAIHESFDTKSAIQIIAIMGAVTILAPAFGPLFGGIIVTYYGWQMIFFILAVLGVISFIGLTTFMPAKSTKAKPNVKAIARDYAALIINPRYMMFAGLSGLMMAGLVVWIVESVFVIQNTYQRTEIEYGLIQFMIFFFMIVGSIFTRWLIQRTTTAKLIDKGATLCLIGGALMLIINVFVQEDLSVTVICMSVICFGFSLVYGPLTRCAIDSAEQPMGVRMALHSTIANILVFVGVYLLTLVNDMTLDNLSLMVCLPIVVATLGWLLMHRFKLINIPNPK